MRLQRSSGLVGHWKFNEKSGIIANDSSRYRNTGTLVGATHLPIWTDKGIKFDGVDDYVNCGNNASLNITQAITVSVWVKPIIGTQMNVVNHGVYNTSGYYVAIGSSGNIRFLDKNLYGGGTLDSISTIPNDTWSHVAITYNNSNVSIYLNGSIDKVDAKTGKLSTPLSNLLIGIYSSLSSEKFKGSIDEVRIYNRALSASEIKQNYEATKHNYI